MEGAHVCGFASVSIRHSPLQLGLLLPRLKSCLPKYTWAGSVEPSEQMAMVKALVSEWVLLGEYEQPLFC